MVGNLDQERDHLDNLVVDNPGPEWAGNSAGVPGTPGRSDSS